MISCEIGLLYIFFKWSAKAETSPRVFKSLRILYGWRAQKLSRLWTQHNKCNICCRNCIIMSTLHAILVELAERSPIITQNRSNPSRWKNLDLWLYKVVLLTCHGMPTPRLCSVIQWSVHWAPSQTTQVLVLARARCCTLEMCGKKMRAPLLGLAKSIYYID